MSLLSLLLSDFAGRRLQGSNLAEQSRYLKHFPKKVVCVPLPHLPQHFKLFGFVVCTILWATGPARAALFRGVLPNPAGELFSQQRWSRPKPFLALYPGGLGEGLRNRAERCSFQAPAISCQGLPELFANDPTALRKFFPMNLLALVNLASVASCGNVLFQIRITHTEFQRINKE